MSRSEVAIDAPARDSVDVVVVGGGSAGLSAAKILARSRRSVVVIDAGKGRNAPAAGVHNYLYAEGTAPAALLEIGRREVHSYGVEIVEGQAIAATVLADLRPGAARFRVEVGTDDGAGRIVGARRMVLATGLVDVLPEVKGVSERWGRDVLHCPFCHGWEVRDQAIGVLGTNSMALHQVMLFRQLTSDVVYFQHTAPDPTDEQVEQLAALGVEWVVGEVAAVQTSGDALSGVQLGDGRVVARQALVISTGLEARTDLLSDLGLATTELELGGVVAGHYLPTDPAGLTATPGVWAAGNVAAPMAQVITSAAAGSGVGAAIHMDLITQDTQMAVAALRARQESGSRPFSASVEAENCERVLGDRRHGITHTAMTGTSSPAEEFWEPHYAAAQAGAGGPNTVLVDTVGALSPGDALDLGCGDGGDALWLADQGWSVLTVDVSATALARVADRATAADLTDRVRTERHDLDQTFPQGHFDLISAQYLLSPVPFDRATMFGRAAAALRPEGVLLIVDHASVAPWSWADPDTVFPTPQELLAGFELDPELWLDVQAENRDRMANGPDGQRATITDTILTLTRKRAEP